MVHDGANWRMTTRRAVLALIAARMAVCVFRWRRRFKRKASCARPASTSPRACRASIRLAARAIRPGSRGSTRTSPAGPWRSAERPPRQIGARFDASLCALFTQSLSACSDGYRDGGCSDQPVSSARRRRRRRIGQKRKQRPAPRRCCRPLSTCAPSPTNSWPRSTARCPTRRPMNWRGVTASCVCNRRISR